MLRAAATMIVLVVAAAAIVFLYVARLTRGAAPPAVGDPGSRATATAIAFATRTGGQVGSEPGEGDSLSGARSSRRVPGSIPTPPDSGARIVTYVDPAHGFRLSHLDSWQPIVIDDAPPPGRPPRYDVVFLQPGSAERLAVTVWPEPATENLDSLAAMLDPAMRSVDDRLPANADIAGAPALIAWREESPTTPATYAALLVIDGTAYAVQYAAGNGGRMLQEFLRAVVSFELGPGSSADTVPPIPRPAARYFPVDPNG